MTDIKVITWIFYNDDKNVCWISSVWPYIYLSNLHQQHLASMVLKTFPMLLFFRKRFSLGNIINHKLDLKDSVCCLLSKMDQEKCTLTWHTYSDHLRNILKEISSDDSFADVTLVTDDKKQMKAHRNILSACSPVFKDILQINTNDINPVIYLRGIQYPEMESILEFIYLGEAKFYKERMNEFIMVAKNLDIRELGKGILIGNSASAYNTNIEAEESANVTYDMEKSIKVDVDEVDIKEDKSKHEVVKYSCNQCDHQATNRSNLIKHIQAKHEGVRYACNQCSQQFATQSCVTLHIQSVHEGIKHDCTHCDYKATTQGHLRTHFQSKHEGVKYACNQCDHQATNRSNLIKHIQAKHEGVRYACNQCKHQFSTQPSLIRHIQSIHEGIKYSCNQCEYQATTQSSLTTHIQSKHEGVKYGCNQCDYQATTQSHLRSHIQSLHEGVKYACNQCDYQSKFPSGLRYHIENLHESVKYACNHCDYQASDRSNLIKHVKRKHL